MNPIKKLQKLRNEWKEAAEEASGMMQNSQYRRNFMTYAEALNTKKVDSDMVLYESSDGRGMIDNPYAIFCALLHDPQYARLKHVWVLDDPEDNRYTIEQYESYSNVQFVKRNTAEYFEALAQAKYLVNNATFQAMFAKRKEQVYINTWHGTPLKYMGYDLAEGSTGAANIVRNFLQADYLISANKVLTDMYLKSYKMQNIMPGCIIEEGYPRNDLLVKTPPKKVLDFLKSHGVEVEEGKQIILYAPTWKGNNVARPDIDPEELLGIKTYLEQHIDAGKYQILIKPHQFVYRCLKDIEEYKGLLVPATIDTNELLSVVDILISDYSSIFLDYMALGRPVLFYIPDFQNYKENRGLYVDIDELPGPCSGHLEELAHNIADIEHVRVQYQEKYKRMQQRMCPYEDGKVTERLLRMIFEAQPGGNIIKAKREKKRLLISGGGIRENGITHSFMSLLEQIDYSQWDVTAYLYVNNNDSSSRAKANSLNPNVRTMVRCGTLLDSQKEEARRLFVRKHGLYRRTFQSLYPWKTMEREFGRCFGMAEFDYIVDFNGYSDLFGSVLAMGKAEKKSIWLHSDIKADMNRVVAGEKPNYDSLHFNVSLYPKFDRIVSCSHSVMEVNRANLSTQDTYDKYTYAKNAINAPRIRKCLEEKNFITIDNREYLIKNTVNPDRASKNLQLVALPQKQNINFVTMGRMSTEKNHLALIEAFARLHEEDSNVRLFIIGDGPLRAAEEKKIKSLNAEEFITLTGNISNPFALMERCQCFVLPSLHEGQPLVLLEARACGLSIIVSDFSTVKDSLYPEGQLVIGKKAEDIYEGMKAYVKGEVPVCPFDLDAYNKEAYEEFLAAIQ